MIAQDLGVELALAAFRRLMASLQVARTQRGADPWSDCPMTMPQLRALSLIVAAPRGLSSRELAASLGVGASAVTPMVDRLVEHGFVLRHEDPHDRRIARLTATESGSAMLERMIAGKGDVLREALGHLSPEQLQQVTAALDVLSASLSTAKDA
ncbi:MAG: MarR family transcriptional regulator [Chloroflexi bacterium]|nr:MarR family transcriptional regulator [Chloroflexota bacterium]MBV9602463.1 MarR family transcriptional regulator [Chloroflexota bacterium]